MCICVVLCKSETLDLLWPGPLDPDEPVAVKTWPGPADPTQPPWDLLRCTADLTSAGCNVCVCVCVCVRGPWFTQYGVKREDGRALGGRAVQSWTQLHLFEVKSGLTGEFLSKTVLSQVVKPSTFKVSTGFILLDSSSYLLTMYQRNEHQST